MLSLNVQLFKLRYFQIKRDLSYWVFIIAIIAFYVSKNITETSLGYCSVFAGLILFFLYNYHLNRKDFNFIKHYLNRPKIQVCINYNLLILPLSFALAFGIYWKYLFIVHLLVSLISFTDIKIQYFKFLFISKYVPSSHFEWISGLRKNLPALFFIFLLAIIFSPVKLFGIVALLLLNLLFLGFYNYFEPLIMLNPENLSAEVFLNKKVSFLSRVTLLLNAPLLLINTLFNPEVVWFNTGFMFAFLLLAASTVYIKYASYKPNTSMRLSIDFLILFSSILLPYLIPLGIFIYFSNKKKAIANLTNYLR